MIGMPDEATTLMGREEAIGKPYPLWMERVFLLSAVVAFVYTHSSINETIGHDVLGPLVAYIVYPLTLLSAVEVAGRLLQRSRTS